MLFASAGAGRHALAASTGSVTITPPKDTQNGTTTEYKINRVFDANSNNTGANVTYTLLSGQTTVPDVRAQYTSAGITFDKSQHPHLIVDTQNQVYYGTGYH